MKFSKQLQHVALATLAAAMTLPASRADAQSMQERQTATLFYGAGLTYQQLDSNVNQIGHALHGLGVQPGDRVMVVLPNMPQMIVAYYPTLKIGGVVVLPNPDASGRAIIRQIKETGAKVLVTLREFGGLAREVREQVPLTVVFADVRSAVSGSVYRELLARWKAAGLEAIRKWPTGATADIS